MSVVLSSNKLDIFLDLQSLQFQCVTQFSTLKCTNQEYTRNFFFPFQKDQGQVACYSLDTVLHLHAQLKDNAELKSELQIALIHIAGLNWLTETFVGPNLVLKHLTPDDTIRPLLLYSEFYSSLHCKDPALNYNVHEKKSAVVQIESPVYRLNIKSLHLRVNLFSWFSDTSSQQAVILTLHGFQY